MRPTMSETSVPTRLGLTPSQTVGPFLHIALSWADGEYVVPDGTPTAIRISGSLYDGAGAAVPDGIVETWQADAAGRFVHPDDPRGMTVPFPAGFRGFGRSATDEEGRWSVLTVVPGPLPTPAGPTEAPHLDVSVFARGLLDRVVTRIYFPDEPANDADPVLGLVDPARRATLVATREDGRLRFDIHLQGEHETVFFDL
jgi:protocatechuate 3,4-dioxygenase, alpha subunit